jgi:elongation factor 2
VRVGWAFTLNKFSRIYAKKLGIEADKLRARLWGESYFNPASKKWQNSPQGDDGKPLERAFSQARCAVRDAR